MSSVSSPVTSNGEANTPVTKHDPSAIADVPANGLGTVVAPGGACPLCVNLFHNRF